MARIRVRQQREQDGNADSGKRPADDACGGIDEGHRYRADGADQHDVDDEQQPKGHR